MNFTQILDTSIFCFSYLNDSKEAHIVVVAKDSGTPARQTSVAVAVSFGEDSNKYGRRLSGFENLEDDAFSFAFSFPFVARGDCSQQQELSVAEKRRKTSFGSSKM